MIDKNNHMDDDNNYEDYYNNFLLNHFNGSNIDGDYWNEGRIYEIQNDYIPDIYNGPILVIELLFSLIIEKEYDDFDTFFNESKEIIYIKMIDLYETIKDPLLDDITLVVLATIDDNPFNSNFSINKNTSELLMDVIIPFFESIEEYETCDRALKLYHRLQGN